jgi:hypothetical protein
MNTKQAISAISDAFGVYSDTCNDACDKFDPDTQFEEHFKMCYDAQDALDASCRAILNALSDN